MNDGVKKASISTREKNPRGQKKEKPERAEEPVWGLVFHISEEGRMWGKRAKGH